MGRPKRQLPQRPPPPGGLNSAARPRMELGGELWAGGGGDERLSLQGTVQGRRQAGGEQVTILPPATETPQQLLQSPPNRSAPKSSSRPQVPAISPGADELESVTRSGSEGWDSQGGSEGSPRLARLPLSPCGRPGGLREPSGELRGAGREARGDRTHRAELLGSVLHAPGSGSRRRLQPSEPRMRGCRPAAAQRQPAPRPSPWDPQAQPQLATPIILPRRDRSRPELRPRGAQRVQI